MESGHTQFTLSAVASACASLPAVIEGNQVHVVLVKTGFGSNNFVIASLIYICMQNAEALSKRTPNFQVLKIGMLSCGIQ